MRTFLILGFALLASFSVFARETIRLDSGWQFKLGDSIEATNAKFKALGWQIVNVPHNWGWEDAEKGRDYYQGPGWYRRNLNIAKPEAGKRYFVKFEAAGAVAQVYVNGNFVGEHRGAFGAFAFEITSALAASGTNLLAVRVSNATDPMIAPPPSADFPVYGGLYRPAYLIVTGEQGFAITDHGSPGVAWLQTQVSQTQAVLDVTAQISNGTNKREPLTLVASVFDENNFLITQSEQDIVAATNMISPYFLRVTVPEPHLWNGRKDPYLYRATVELRASNNVVDSVEQPLGLRYFSVDPDKGFFLNGRPYHLHGVSRHQDRFGKGWALSEADQDEDVDLIKELGATAVRCAHYQQSDYFYSLCDQAGILVWAEIPQVNTVRDAPEYENNSRNQLLDLIRQNINHPSIFCWSLFNELGPGTDDPHRELQDLNNLAHGEDPTRPTIGATRTMVFPQMNKIPDLLGWNIYSGWYDPPYGSKDNFGTLFDKYRQSSKMGGFCLSEYGAGANTLQHQENPPPSKPTGAWHPEEWQNEVHEAAWAQIKSHPFIWGSFVWNMFDFTSYFRREGGVEGVNDKGLVTHDRKIKKDAFYFYKANWSDEPVLYISSRRFIEHTNAITDVKIYSNLKSPVELFINGISKGGRNDTTDCVLIWKDIELKKGENQIEVRSENDSTNITDHCHWLLK